MSYIKNMSMKIWNPNTYGLILFLLLILLLPNLFVTFLSTDLSGSLVKKAAYLFFSLLLLFIPALFLKLRWYFLFESIFMLIAPFEIGYVLLFKSIATEGYISSVFNTSWHEAAELLLSIKWQCLLFLCIWVTYYMVVFKKIQNNFLFTRKASIAIGLLFIVFNVMLFGAMYMLEYRHNKSETRMDLVVDNFASKYRKTYPCSMISILGHKYQAKLFIDDMQKNTASFSFHAKQRTTLPEREIYLLVIGESARYGNFSINGYARETSPRLAQKQGLLSYNDVYSVSNVTEYLLPLLLSRATPLDPQRAYREKSVVDAFQECGFHTAWIANQSIVYPYIKHIAEVVDDSYFTLSDFDSENNHDAVLLQYVDSTLNKDQQKTLIIIHTLGSHFRYNFRYPKEFEKFKPALGNIKDYSFISESNKEILINSYDNTIFYTDFILSEIIRKVEEKQAISAVLYISDHAENLYDDRLAKVMHGSKNPPVKEIHVPFFIWTSSLYQSIHSRQQMALERSVDKKISSSNIFHTLLDIANISYPEEALEKSIASDAFKEDSIRYVYSPNKQVIPFQ